MQRLKSCGHSCLPVKVNNISFFPDYLVPFTAYMAITKEDEFYVNRVECDTAFDFDRVEMILISEPKPCPVKEGYNYVSFPVGCEL